MRNRKSQPKDIKRALLTVLALNKNIAMRSGDILASVKLIYKQTPSDKKIYRGNMSFFDNMFNGTFSSRAFQEDNDGKILIDFIKKGQNGYLYQITPAGSKHLLRIS